METSELKKLIRNIGDSVHSMNTIAVGLSKLNSSNCNIPEGLDISWNPKAIDNSILKARNYAERAAIIYSVESFFDYLETISENPFWSHPEINFLGNEKKAERVFNFLNKIPNIPDELKILSELACQWRNKIVHASASRAKLATEKIGRIRQLKDYIIENYYHFDIYRALDNFENVKITPKDASTLITILIKTARLVDEFFFEEISLEKSKERITNYLYNHKSFSKIIKQPASDKKHRQIYTFVNMSFSFISKEYLKLICDEIESRIK